jgi:hypothetical protein
VRCCAELLCYSPAPAPSLMLLVTAMSLSVAFRVLREGARATRMCVLVLIVVVSWHLGAFSQHSVAGVQGRCQGRSFACREAWVSWCRCCGASCSKLFYPSRCLAMQGLGSRWGVGGHLRRKWPFMLTAIRLLQGIYRTDLRKGALIGGR